MNGLKNAGHGEQKPAKTSTISEVLLTLHGGVASGGVVRGVCLSAKAVQLRTQGRLGNGAHVQIWGATQIVREDLHDNALGGEHPHGEEGEEPQQHSAERP